MANLDGKGQWKVSFTFRYITRTYPVLPTYDIGDEEAEFVLAVLDGQGNGDTSLMRFRESSEEINPDDDEIRLILRESPLRPEWTSAPAPRHSTREQALGYGRAKSKLVKRVLDNHGVGDGLKLTGNFHTFRHTFSLLATPVDTPSTTESISSPLRSLVHLDRCQVAHNEPLGWFVTLVDVAGDGESGDENDEGDGRDESGERMRFLLRTSHLTASPSPQQPTVLFSRYALKWDQDEQQREQKEAERQDRVVKEVARDLEARERAKRVGVAGIEGEGPSFRREDSELDPLARESLRKLVEGEDALAYEVVQGALSGTVNTQSLSRENDDDGGDGSGNGRKGRL
ncbi:hypothetical protein HDU93_004781 [Gonapodya sp. JEL0774]|nr:hypothetical protein HDU93_004781 [Gonapodya sp. JEL0774]